MSTLQDKCSDLIQHEIYLILPFYFSAEQSERPQLANDTRTLKQENKVGFFTLVHFVR